jgi:DNA-binding transcriptional LysR family regulator
MLMARPNADNSLVDVAPLPVNDYERKIGLMLAVEAAFASGPFTAPSLQARRVFEERLVLVTSKAICKVSGPADLGRSTLIAFAQGCSYRKRIEECTRSARAAPPARHHVRPR